MLLKDYLSKEEHGRKILIVSDPARGQALIRKHEAKTGMLVRNVDCMTIDQMVDILYRYTLAESGFREEYEYLEDSEAMMLFRGIIFKNIKELHFFKNEKMLDLVTTSEIFKKANLVRTNGWNGEEDKEKNDRVSDLKLLISEFEERLEIEKKLDPIAREKLVLNTIRGWSDIKSEISGVFSAEISYLAEDARYYDGIRLDFLSLLQNAKDSAIHAFEDDLSIEMLSDCGWNAEFYKGYGSYNEANYIVNDILEKEYPLGSVTVLYSSNSQLPAISAAFCGNGLRMRNVTKYPAKDNAYISLAKRVISWAQEDYSEKALNAVLLSPVISVMTDDGSGGLVNALSGQGYFDYVLEARNRREDAFILGWGYERNKDFIKHEEGIVSEESVKEILKMHGVLLDIFGDKGVPYDDKNKVRPIDVYKKLVSFVETYTCQSEEYSIGIDKLRSLSGTIYLEDRILPLDETLEFVDELLNSITISDASEDGAVLARSMSNWTVLERPHTYVIGLALRDMQGNTTESPVLFDDEMERCLAKGYVPTIRNESERRESSLLLSLSSFDGKSIVFGYSDYDTINSCDNNASAFFREALSSLSSCNIDDIPEFVYGNPTGGTGSVTVPAFVKRPSFDVRMRTSNSSLEVLLDCPKKYAYDKIMHIPDNTFTESDYGQWLDARITGSFFHEIVEKYCKERMIISAGKTYESKVDEDLLQDIAEKIEARLLTEVPCAFKELADRETSEMIMAASKYLQELAEELNGGPWRVLAAEQRFIEATYPVKDFAENEHSFEFAGVIDRIDYQIDKSLRKCYLRITDYKTGRRNNKESADELGKLIQHAIYKKALMETGYVEKESKGKVRLLEHVQDLVAELEEDISVKEYSYEFFCFQYIFPFEPDSNEPIRILEKDLEDINLIRLRAILSIVGSMSIYPDHKELKDVLDALMVDYPEYVNEIIMLRDTINNNYKEEIKSCDYCEYKHLCINRKAGEIK